jgi:succinoglycan biosynthesis protein ExoA
MKEHVASFPPNPTADVLVAIPCLNEEDHIESVVESILSEADEVRLKIVVADGGSTDGTRAIVARLACKDSRVVLLDNPRKIQSAAINEAVRIHGEEARILIRIDGHADYPERYCSRLIAAQVATGADSVVVTMRTKGRSCFQRAAAAAQNSILGNGGSSHRNATRGCWVDHGHHALMMLSAFRAIGGYDETFSHNEDAEFDVRFKEAGNRIFLAGEMPITYYPRRTAPALFRQYFNIGRGRARNFLKHRSSTKVRHLFLVAVAPAICLLLFAPLAPTLALPAVAWSMLCLAYGLFVGLRSRDACAAASGIAAMATHAGWSFGFVVELLATSARIGIAALESAARRHAALRGSGHRGP